MRDFLGHVGAWAPRPEQIATAKFIRNPQAIASFRETMDAGIRTRLEALAGELMVDLSLHDDDAAANAANSGTVVRRD